MNGAFRDCLVFKNRLNGIVKGRPLSLRSVRAMYCSIGDKRVYQTEGMRSTATLGCDGKEERETGGR